MKRAKPLRRVGARAKREAEALEVFRTLVFARAQWACESCGLKRDPCPWGRTLEAHHRLPRSRGGKHELTNGAALCGTCHRQVHDHTHHNWKAWLIETAPKKG